MSSPDAAPPVTARRAVGLLVWINAIGATILIGTELVLLAVSFDWAVAGIMQLQRNVALGLLAVLLAACAWVCWSFFMSALRAERRLADGTFDARTPAS